MADEKKPPPPPQVPPACPYGKVHKVGDTCSRETCGRRKFT